MKERQIVLELMQNAHELTTYILEAKYPDEIWACSCGLARTFISDELASIIYNINNAIQRLLSENFDFSTFQPLLEGFDGAYITIAEE